jgi:hypothetical protein
MMDEHDDRKIPPSVPLQSAAAAHVERVAEQDKVELASNAQAILAHVRALERSFVAAADRAGQSIALDRAKTLVMEARQWVVTHYAT